MGWRALCAMALLLVSHQLLAGKIEGYVTDAETGETLPGATVKLEGTTRGVITNLDGFYSLDKLPEGNITVIAEFMGYHDQEFSFNSTPGGVYEHNFILVKSSSDLGEVIISGRATGQVKTMRDQREAPNIMNIISEEQIISFPDLNAADALARVPGVTLQRDQGEGRYVQIRGTPPWLSNFNINGIQLPSPESSVRTVGMDVINASQIQTLEIAKVLTPDMNGDAIGGAINIITKRAESPDPEFNVVVAGGYNDLRGTPNSDLQFSFGQRVGKFGLLINANRTQTIQGSDNMEFDYTTGPFLGGSGVDNFNIHYSEVQQRHYDINRERVGLTGTFDYYLDEKNRIFVNGIYNRFTDDEIRRRKIYTLDDPISERTYLFGGIEHDIRDRTQIQTISQVSLGGEHEARRFKISYEFAWSEATEEQPDLMEARFENPGQAIQIKWDLTEPEFPVPTFPGDQDLSNATDYENFDLDQLLFEDLIAIDQNLTGRLDIEIPYDAGKWGTGQFKFGTLLRYKDKSRDVRAQSFGAYRAQSNLYPISGPELSLATVSDDFVDNDFLDGRYVLDNMVSADMMREFYEMWPTLFIFGDAGITESLELSFTQDYEAEEDIEAYYAMVTHNIGKLMILSGVRYERTTVDYTGTNFRTIPSGFFDTLVVDRFRQVRDFWLPNLQFKYSFDRSSNLRAAISYSYARPNFEDVIPARRRDRDELEVGFPFLQFPSAMNLDLLFEKYWKGRNMFSAGVFYKDIEDFVFRYSRFAYQYPPGLGFNQELWDATLPVNGQDAFVTGFETQVFSFFDFLPGKLKNLGGIVNYTYTYSEGRIPRRADQSEQDNILVLPEDIEDFDSLFEGAETETIAMPGQAPHTLNLSLFYDSPKWYFKISANYSDIFLETIGATRDLDQFYAAQWRVDLNGYYQINKNIQIFGDVRNVTNEPFRFYLGPQENNRILLTEFYSFWARIGARLNF